MLFYQFDMSLISKIFGKRNQHEDPKIMFGRYSDSYKSDDKYESWDQAIAAFEKKAYKECYLKFFEYLRDDQTNNVNITNQNEKVSFELFQGSKKIVGEIANDKIIAEAKIALSEENEIGVLRKLIEMNFNLKYCRYALDRDENITIVFNSYFMDCSPYKLYYALKEISTHADKQDDILMSEFDSLEEVNTGHIRKIADQEIRIKYDFLMKRLNEVLDRFENGKLNKIKYPGGKSFDLLDVVYKLDFLLKPEGVTMQTFENIHKEFFKQNSVSAHQKNEFIVKNLKELIKTPYEEFAEEIYEVLSTFGVTSPTSFDQYKNFASGELENFNWYVENQYDIVARAIPSYIVGYSLFNYSLPKPLSELMHLFYVITEQEFFNDLGFNYDYTENEKINKSRIKAKLKSIKNDNKANYPKFNPKIDQIDFSSMTSFATSFLKMTLTLNMEKVEKKK